ncbi:MAG: hypothetical protein A4E62_02978 [Syntrophorhabdus sp. PtaU1.Bin002]|nr:MAG: hypothetical protein A4E62_02978 [Syntrophorhabdus sp. PtaU1.Bin002]
MIEGHFEHWDRLFFRDYLIEHPEVAQEYGALKLEFSQIHQNDRVAYTKAKADFILGVTEAAKEHYGKAVALGSDFCRVSECRAEEK